MDCFAESIHATHDDLLRALEFGDLDFARKAMRHSSFVVDHQLGKDGATPLIAASRGGHPDMVKLVLDHHANLAAADHEVQ
jgi:ankyrin repeat protein